MSAELLVELTACEGADARLFLLRRDSVAGGGPQAGCHHRHCHVPRSGCWGTHGSAECWRWKPFWKPLKMHGQSITLLAVP